MKLRDIVLWLFLIFASGSSASAERLKPIDEKDLDRAKTAIFLQEMKAPPQPGCDLRLGYPDMKEILAGESKNTPDKKESVEISRTSIYSNSFEEMVASHLPPALNALTYNPKALQSSFSEKHNKLTFNERYLEPIHITPTFKDIMGAYFKAVLDYANNLKKDELQVYLTFCYQGTKVRNSISGEESDEKNLFCVADKAIQVLWREFNGDSYTSWDALKGITDEEWSELESISLGEFAEKHNIFDNTAVTEIVYGTRFFPKFIYKWVWSYINREEKGSNGVFSKNDNFLLKIHHELQESLNLRIKLGLKDKDPFIEAPYLLLSTSFEGPIGTLNKPGVYLAENGIVLLGVSSFDLLDLKNVHIGIGQSHAWNGSQDRIEFIGKNFDNSSLNVSKVNGSYLAQIDFKHDL